jgi:hypothetical protein
MNKFLKRSSLAGGLLVMVLGISGQASAHLLPGGVVIDFGEDVASPSYAIPASVFPAFGQSYNEEGVVHSAIGFGTTPGNSMGVMSGGTSHVHGNNLNGSWISQLAPDAGGGFFQLADKDAFSVGGLDVSKIELTLADGTESTLTFRAYTDAAFSSWTDVVVGETNGSPFDVVGGVFDTETGPGFNGTHLHLDEVAAFGEVYLLEYFFDAPGRGNDPGAVANFSPLILELDNIELGQVAAVPVPAAVYLFGTGLLGLLGVRKKQVGVSVA